MQSGTITPDFKYIPTGSMYAYFPFDSDLLDHKADLGESGSALSMNTYGSVSLVNGKVGKCLSVNNSGLHGTGIRTGNVSIMFRAYRTGAGSNEYQGMVIDHGYLGLFARGDVDKITSFNWGGGGGTGIIQMQYNQRYHCAIVGNGSQCYVFINGVKYGPYGMGTSGQSADSGLRIGMGTYSSQRFIGYIDEVLVYKRLLADNEVIKYYNKTK